MNFRTLKPPRFYIHSCKMGIVMRKVKNSFRGVAMVILLIASTSQAQPCIPPAQPTGFKATAVSSSEIDLSWNPVPDAIGYDVHYCDETYIGFTAYPSYQHTGRVGDTEYSYKIRAQKSASCLSSFTSCVSARTLGSSVPILNVRPDKLEYLPGQTVVFSGSLSTSTGQPVPNTLVGVDDPMMGMCIEGPRTDISGNFRYESLVPTYASGIFGFKFQNGSTGRDKYCIISIKTNGQLNLACNATTTNLGVTDDINNIDLALTKKTPNGGIPKASNENLLNKIGSILNEVGETFINSVVDFVSNPVNDIAVIGAGSCTIAAGWTGAGLVACYPFYNFVAKAYGKSLVSSTIIQVVNHSDLSDEEKLYWKEVGNPGAKCIVGIVFLDPTYAISDALSSTSTSWTCGKVIVNSMQIGYRKILKAQALPSSSSSSKDGIGIFIMPLDPQISSPTVSGITWDAGSTHSIAWSGFTRSSVKIELYKGTALNTIISSSTTNDGSFSWTIPAIQAAGTDYKIRITSTSNAAEVDNSDNNFAISSTSPQTRTLTVESLNPNSGAYIIVVPNDKNGQGNGVTQFSRAYDNNTSVTLTASSIGDGSNFRKWQKDGVDYSSNQIVAFSMDANHTMTAVYVMPTECTAPIISANPADATVTEPNGTSFTVVATDGTLPYTYKWQVFTTGTSSWTDISSSSIYSGVMTNTLNISNTTTNMDLNQYRCVVSSGSPCGTSSINSSSAILTVNAAIQTYFISTFSNPESGGTTIGNGYYSYRQVATVVAKSNPGYTFVNWTENGSQVSSTATYPFYVTGNKNLVANFTTCQYKLISSSVTLYSPEQQYEFRVYTKSECDWTATSNNCNDMITMIQSNGKGDGRIIFKVSENKSTSPRTCTISIGGQTFTVTQNGYVAPCATAPNAITNLEANANYSNQIHVGWNYNALNQTNFEIERGLSSTGPFTVVAIVEANISVYQDTNVVGGTTYFYRVRACCNTNCSDYSNVVSQQACTFSTTPTGISATADTIFQGEQVTLTVEGGSLGTGAAWTWRTLHCGSGPFIGTGSSITVTPNVNTVYTVKPEGGNCPLASLMCAGKNIIVKQLPKTPTITVSTISLSDFGNVVVGQNSSPQPDTISGTNLTSDITIQAPPEFEISFSATTGFTNSLTLIQSGGTVTFKTIYVRFSPTSTGFQSGYISYTSSGATTKNVFVSGTGNQACTPVTIATQPQNQSINSGDTATFSVSVNGTGPFSYFWYKNDVNISTTTNSASTTNSYTTPTLTVSDNGSYFHCSVLNCGNLFPVYSNKAYLAVITDVDDNHSRLPNFYNIYQNYPNPFNPTTKIRFDIPKQTWVKLSIYDILGREVSVLVDKGMYPGSYEITFDGSKLTSGIYFYRLQTGGFVKTKKLIMIK